MDELAWKVCLSLFFAVLGSGKENNGCENVHHPIFVSGRLHVTAGLQKHRPFCLCLGSNGELSQGGEHCEKQLLTFKILKVSLNLNKKYNKRTE